IGYTADDALVTFRYAENLVQGKGFVYNDGERVLGTTAPLFGLVVALFLLPGISPFVTAFLINTACDLFTAWVLFRMFSSSRDEPSGGQWLCFLAPAVFLLNPESLQWSLSGMETSAAIALLFAACWWASKDSWKLAFAAGAAALLVRIDGVAVL